MEVFATPAMIALMEQTAYNSVMSLLPEEWTTVGTELHIEHCKATPLSTKVRCESVLNKVEGRKLIFILTVYDEEDIIGKGTHVRCIVNTEKFLDKLKQRKE
jgi:predicted thioesterase